MEAGLLSLAVGGVVSPSSDRSYLSETRGRRPVLRPEASLAAPGKSGVEQLTCGLASQDARRGVPRQAQESVPLAMLALFGGRDLVDELAGHGRSRAPPHAASECLRLTDGRPLRHHFSEVMISPEFAAVQADRTAAKPV